MITCPSCGTENPAGFRFCGACGSTLGTAATAQAAREERKVVTVLFCDLVGSTERAELMDPEDVRAMLGRYHERVRTDLERHGGTVEKFIGDAAMALFGAPVAHEDDPERAVRAALAIRDWAIEGGDLQVRIGITTGEALVSLDAQLSRGEGMAAGDVVNTAARLQAAAGVDAILVDETTHRATRDRIDYRQAEAVVAKGKSQPIPAWEAAAARSRLGLDVAESAPTPLVGRARDLELLVSAFERTRRDRIVELITLIGEPGIGKSRLVTELLHHVEADPDLIRWRQGRCLPYGEGVTLWALAEIVKAETGVLETDGADSAGAKVADTIRRVIPDEAEATWVEQHVRPLAGISADAVIGGERRDEAFVAWRRFIESVAEQGPLVLIFEDLQWADDSLLDFVDHLVEWAADVPLFVLAIARPELLARRPGWGGGKPNAMTRSLAPLSDDETAALVHARLGRALLPAEVQRSLVERAEGNPLYAEEFARAFQERGAADGAALPESVQGLIAARLDGLEPKAKALLQDAAVLGKVFWLGGLAAVSAEDARQLEGRLHELERRELVRRDRASAVAGERQYAFRHQLVRDVAYAQIPRGGRAEKHAAAAHWIEGMAADRSDDRAEMLAHHWSAALRYAEAAGETTAEFGKRAIQALTDAGDRALALHAVSAAVLLYEQALEIIGDDLPADLLLRHARSLDRANDERADAALERARDALIATGDVAGEAFAEEMLSHRAWLRGDADAARRRSDRAVQLVEAQPPSEIKARVLARAASTAQVGGRDADAVRLAREALAICDELNLVALRVHAQTTLGSARLGLGDLEGVHDVERAYEVGLETNSAEAGRAGYNLGVQNFLLGDIGRYRQLHAESRRVMERFADRWLIRFSQGAEASISYFVGDWDTALRQADEFIAASAAEPHYQERHSRAFRSVIRFARDDVEGALADIDAVLLGPSDPQSRALPLSAASRIYTELGDPRAAETSLQVLEIGFGMTPEPLSTAFLSSIDVPDAVRDRLVEVIEAYATSPSRWVTGARAALEGRFLDAAEIYAGMPFVGVEADVRQRAAEELVAEGRLADAEEQLELALAFWRSVGATRYIRRAEQLRDRIVA
jgi:class 3 adenylate cyclase